jgi:hypothetical protein
MSDFKDLREVLEMAEVLDDEYEQNLVCKTVNITNDTVVNVLFTFNEDNELIGVYVEND